MDGDGRAQEPWEINAWCGGTELDSHRSRERTRTKAASKKQGKRELPRRETTRAEAQGLWWTAWRPWLMEVREGCAGWMTAVREDLKMSVGEGSPKKSLQPISLSCAPIY